MSLSPDITFENLDPADVLSAIKSNRNQRASYRRIAITPPLGRGFEAFIRWAFLDAEHAAAVMQADEQERYAVSALMNARRALSCLVDQYLVRDGLTFCKDPPRNAEESAALLVQRGVLDGLASDALKRAVGRRSLVEHQYKLIGLGEVRETVQLVRATIETCVQKSDPYQAPAYFGIILGGSSYGPNGWNHTFGGWTDLVFVFARCDVPPWFGIVIPESETTAKVRKVTLKELTCAQLVEILNVLEQQSPGGGSGSGEDSYREYLKFLGLIQ